MCGFVIGETMGSLFGGEWILEITFLDEIPAQRSCAYQVLVPRQLNGRVILCLKYHVLAVWALDLHFRGQRCLIIECQVKASGASCIINQ